MTRSPTPRTLDSVVPQNASDGVGIEVVSPHEAVHVLVLCLRHIVNRCMKLGKRRRHAVTAPR
jgi:hypothetical protein